MRASLTVVLGVLVAAAAAQGAGLDVSLGPYLDAQRAGEVGAVEGRAWQERRRPDGPDLPLAGTTVTLVPRSEALLGALEELKRGARGSVRAYREAAPAMRLAQEAYERALWEAGAAELVRPTLVDADGRFRIDGVPAGVWLLSAAHAVFVETPTPRVSRRERELFLIGPRLVGYWSVTRWLRQVTVPAGGTVRVNLTDRNGWFLGIVEERVPDADR